MHSCNQSVGSTAADACVAAVWHPTVAQAGVVRRGRSAHVCVQFERSLRCRHALPPIPPAAPLQHPNTYTRRAPPPQLASPERVAAPLHLVCHFPLPCSFPVAHPTFYFCTHPPAPPAARCCVSLATARTLQTAAARVHRVTETITHCTHPTYIRGRACGPCCTYLPERTPHTPFCTHTATRCWLCFGFWHTLWLKPPLRCSLPLTTATRCCLCLATCATGSRHTCWGGAASRSAR